MHNGIKNNCKKCLLPVLPEAQALGDTSLLFASLHCQCHKLKPAKNSQQKEIAKARCPACGKQKAGAQRVGSFTSYLFKDFRCQCRNSDKATAASVGIKLQKNLGTQFFSKSANKTRMARLEQKMLGRTQMVLSGADSSVIEVLQPGEIIAGSYVLEEQVGLGGMGMVYRAKHRLLSRLCALKFLLPSAVSATSWEMFKTEAKILNELNHPAICQIYDMGLHKGSLPFYAMEYLDGITLEELLNKKNTLSLGAALEIFKAVGSALTYAHRQKIIHKDVKPANIMLVTENDKSIAVKLLDFGIAELADSSGTHAHSDIIGSAAYMSPEQFTGEALSTTTDIYSLAYAFFETLTGTAPFDGKSFQELSFLHQEKEAPSLKETTGQDFPPEIEAILGKALRKESHFRYKYMSEMVIDMERLAEGKELQFACLDSKYLAASGQEEEEEEEEEEETYIPSKITSHKFILGITLGLGTLAIAGSAFYHLHGFDNKKPQFLAIAAPVQKLQFESITEDLAQTAEEIGGMPTTPEKTAGQALGNTSHPKYSNDTNSSRVIAGSMANDLHQVQYKAQPGSDTELLTMSMDNFAYRIILPKKEPAQNQALYRNQAAKILTKLTNDDYGSTLGANFEDYAYSRNGRLMPYSHTNYPVSLVIQENGKTWRVFLFQKNDSIGFLHDPDKTPLLTASGIILMPEAGPLYLLLNERYSPQLEQIFPRFDPEAFSKISLVHLKKLPNLTVLDKQKFLNTLILADCLTTEKDFLSISKRKLVKRLILRDSHFKIGDLTNSGVLNTIEELHFKPDTNQTESFKELSATLGKNANNINTLSLEGEIAPLSLLSLAQSKALKTLAVSEASLSDEHLKMLAKLNNLDQLKIYYFGNRPLVKFSDIAVNTLKNRMGKRLVLSNIPWS
jgi:serine/threonine protein kinase